MTTLQGVPTKSKLAIVDEDLDINSRPWQSSYKPGYKQSRPPVSRCTSGNNLVLVLQGVRRTWMQNFGVVRLPSLDLGK